MVTTAAPYTIVLAGCFAPDGRKADFPWMHEPATDCLDIYAEWRRLHREAEDDPGFRDLTVTFCRVRTFMTYTLRLRRGAFDGQTGEWVGFRQTDGSYADKEAP